MLRSSSQIRPVTPEFNQKEAVCHSYGQISEVIHNQPCRRVFLERLRACRKLHGKVSRTVTGILTIHTIEKHKIKLYTLGNCDVSINPDRGIVVNTKNVVKFNGHFPQVYRLDPHPSTVLSYFSERKNRFYIYVLGRKDEVIEINASANPPRVERLFSFLQ
jgi:hypothetical protein